MTAPSVGPSSCRWGVLANYFELQAVPPLYFALLPLIVLACVGLTQAMTGIYSRRWGWQ